MTEEGLSCFLAGVRLEEGDPWAFIAMEKRKKKCVFKTCQYLKYIFLTHAHMLQGEIFIVVKKAKIACSVCMSSLWVFSRGSIQSGTWSLY